MIKKIALVCGIAIALLALAVTASLPAHAAGGETISASDFAVMCKNDPNHVVPVPSNTLLHIVRGIAQIQSGCDITLGSNASVFINNATIDAAGDFGICSSGSCGTNMNMTVHIFNTIINVGSNGVDLQAFGSSSPMLVQYDTITAKDIEINSNGGTTIVHDMIFNATDEIMIQGMNCIVGNNTSTIPIMSCPK